MLRRLLFIALFSLLPAVAQEMSVKLTFSTDGGKNFTETEPVLENNGEFVVRATFEFTPAVTKGGPIQVMLYNSKEDFASANVGRQRWGGVKWIQRPKRYWFPVSTKSVDFKVDTKARPKGVMGNKNKWEKKKFVDAELPPCKELSKGKHTFTVKIDCKIDGKKLKAETPFTLTISNGPQASAQPTTTNKKDDDDVQITIGTAKEVFVSTSGDDANPGTKSKPVKTVKKGVELVGPSGVVHVAKGTYREWGIRVYASGTEKKPVVIEGEGMHTTLIKGSEEIKGWKKDKGNIWKKEGWGTNSQQVFCDGEHLQQIGAGSPWHTRRLWADKMTLPPVGKDLGDVVENSFYYDPAQQTLYVWLPEGKDPNKHLMEASVATQTLIGGKNSSHIVIKKLGLMHVNGTSEGKRTGIASFGGEYWTYEDCLMQYGDFVGIRGHGKNKTIRRCIIRRNGDIGIDMGNSDKDHNWGFWPNAPFMNVLIENCIIEENNYRHFDSSWHGGGLKVIPAIRGMTIRGCIVRNNHGAGLWFDHPLGENVLEYNVVYGNRTGIMIELASPEENPKIKYSTIIRNNLVMNNRSQGIYLAASRQCLVENNTLIGNSHDIVAHGIPRGKFELHDNIIRNNIMGGAKKSHLILYNGKEKSSNNKVDENFYATGYNIKGFDFGRYDEGQSQKAPRVGVVQGKGYNVNFRGPLDNVRKEKGIEKNGLSGDPKWKDLSKNDFTLGASSPAKGKGIQDFGTIKKVLELQKTLEK